MSIFSTKWLIRSTLLFLALFVFSTGSVHAAADSGTTSSVGLPDLTANPVIKAPFALDTSASGTTFPISAGIPALFTFTYSNIGNASTGTGFDVLLEAATNSSGADATAIRLFHQNNPLGPGYTGATGETSQLVASLPPTKYSNTSSYPDTYYASYVTFPSPGTYYLRGCADLNSIADVTGSIAESNENNNCGAWIPFTVQAPPPPPPPASCTLTASQQQDGTFLLSWQLSRNEEFSISGAGQFSGTTGSVSVSPSVTTTYTGSMSSGFSPPHTDATCSVTVTTSGSPGHGSTSGASSGSVPDFTASSISPTTALANTPSSFSAVISNLGGTSPSGFPDLLQKANDSNGTHASSIGASKTSALSAGGSANATFSYTFSTTGTYYLRACADKASGSDVTGSVPESNENNNCGAWTPIVVSGNSTSGTSTGGNQTPPPTSTSGFPDLTAGAVTPEDSAVGIATLFSSTISNDSITPTQSPFTDIFQVAPDQNPTDQEVLTYYPANPVTTPLSAGATHVDSFYYTPSSPGLVYMRACADMRSAGDTAGNISESNKQNNCGPWTPISVTGSPTDNGTGGNNVSPGSSVCPTIASKTPGIVSDYSRWTGIQTLFYFGTLGGDIPTDVTDFASLFHHHGFDSNTGTITDPTPAPWPGNYGNGGLFYMPTNKYMSLAFNVPQGYFANGPENLYGEYLMGETGFNAAVSMTISTGCGDFSNPSLPGSTVIPNCFVNSIGPDNALLWLSPKSVNSSSHCTLQDGQSYYLNIVNADIRGVTPGGGGTASSTINRCNNNNTPGTCTVPLFDGPGTWGTYRFQP